MNGIDISRWQPNIDLARVPCDFVIVKATQGTGYISPTFKQQITQAYNLQKYIGVYHYASSGGAIAEAEHFLDTVSEWIGKAILVLDWEGEQNANFKNPDYAKAWLGYVKERTGVTPFIYMSKSVCRQYVWDSSYPLWCAQYMKQPPSNYVDNPWTDTKGFGAWSSPSIYQYSSKGKLDGYSGNLDLNKSYISGDEWQAYAHGEHEEIRPILRRGDRNEYVRAWQRYLNLNGYDCGNADGIFGQKTQDAVVRYQQDHGMESGYIGEQTWATVP